MTGYVLMGAGVVMGGLGAREFTLPYYWPETRTMYVVTGTLGCWFGAILFAVGLWLR